MGLTTCCRAGAAGLAAAALLAGCAVGPDFKPPPPPSARTYISPEIATLSDPSGGEPRQRLALGDTLDGDWWTAFHSPELDALVGEALAHNQTLAAARATLAQARESENRVRGGAYPQVDFAPSASLLKTSLLSEGVNQLGPLTSDFSVGPTVSYALDLFGAQRRLREQKHALTDYQAYQADGAALALSGGVARAAIDLARLRGQIETLNALLRDDEETVDLVGRLFALHLRTLSDLDVARGQLAADRALLPPLRQQLAVNRDAVAILTGKPPGEAAPPNLTLDALKLPTSLPVSVPSELVRRRPDVRAAEAQLHAASAAIGVASAQLYPSLNLTAAITQESLSAATLFSPAATGGFVAAGLTAPIFHGGALRAQKREAGDAYDAAGAVYRQTVLTAFGQVADVLQALDHDAELLQAQQQSLDAATGALDAARAQYGVAHVDRLQVLIALRQLELARIDHIGARAQRYLDTVQLFAAMGGGWRR